MPCRWNSNRSLTVLVHWINFFTSLPTSSLMSLLLNVSEQTSQVMANSLLSCKCFSGSLQLSGSDKKSLGCHIRKSLISYLNNHLSFSSFTNYDTYQFLNGSNLCPCSLFLSSSPILLYWSRVSFPFLHLRYFLWALPFSAKGHFFWEAFSNSTWLGPLLFSRSPLTHSPCVTLVILYFRSLLLASDVRSLMARTLFTPLLLTLSSQGTSEMLKIYSMHEWAWNQVTVIPISFFLTYL